MINIINLTYREFHVDKLMYFDDNITLMWGIFFPTLRCLLNHRIHYSITITKVLIVVSCGERSVLGHDNLC